MTSEIVEVEPQQGLHASTSELLSEFRDLYNLTASRLMRMAMIVKELDRRSVDLSEFGYVVPHLRKIASQMLDADLACKLLPLKPKALQYVAELPRDVQKSLASNPVVEVWNQATQLAESIPLTEMNDRQLKIVFGSGGSIRTPAQQRAALIRPRNQKNQANEEKRERQFRVYANHDDRCIQIGHHRLDIGEVIYALAELAGPLPVMAEFIDQETATVRLLPSEKASLKRLMDTSGLPEWHVIRMILHAHSAFSASKKKP
jgi:hypothetical protein